MPTVFLFPANTDEPGCLSLVLDDQGDVLQPLQHRLFSEISKLQAHGRTMIVLPSDRFSLHQVSLPLLSEKKAQAAIPFALEDNVAQPLDALHFAFDKQFYDQGQYLILVCEKIYLHNIVQHLTHHGISFEQITIDWFALQSEEILMLPDYILIHHQQFKGALNETLFHQFLQQDHSSPLQIHQFTDSLRVDLRGQKPLVSDIQALVCVAKALQKKPFINLAQGEFKQKNSTRPLKYWYAGAASLFGFWLFIVLSFNGYKVYHYNQKNNQLDKKIATIYRQFFPNAKQIISPRFRISRWIKTNQGMGKDTLWILLSKLNKVLDIKTTTIEQMNWQKNTLLLYVVTPDFSALDALKNQLTHHHLNVKQKQASTRDNKVFSILELKG